MMVEITSLAVGGGVSKMLKFYVKFLRSHSF